MAQCKLYRPVRTFLCRGDLNKSIEIQTRSLDGSDFDTSQPEENFVTVFSRRSAVETITRGTSGGGKKFAGISIDNMATHMFFVFYDSSLNVIERDNYFVLFNSKRYRVVAVTNMNEDNTTLAIQATDRGEDTAEATKA